MQVSLPAPGESTTPPDSGSGASDWERAPLAVRQWGLPLPSRSRVTSEVGDTYVFASSAGLQSVPSGTRTALLAGTLEPSMSPRCLRFFAQFYGKSTIHFKSFTNYSFAIYNIFIQFSHCAGDLTVSASRIYASDAVPIENATTRIAPTRHYDDYWQLFQTELPVTTNTHKHALLVKFEANTGTVVTNSPQNAFAHRALVALDDIELLAGTCACPTNTTACSAGASQCVENERICDWVPDCLNSAGESQ